MSTPENAAILRSFTRSPRTANRSPRTIECYVQAAEQLETSANDEVFTKVTRADVEGYLGNYLRTHTPGGTAVRFRALRAMFNWMEAEEIIARSPMARMKLPTVPEVPVQVITDADLAKLLKACSGKGFDDRRDTAIIRVLFDCGLPVGELIGLKINDLDMETDVLYVIGKGSRPRAVPFGNKTGQALDRYLRVRAQHPISQSEFLWLGNRGIPIQASGVNQMLRRRASQAGIGSIHAHQLRHTMAHAWRAAGGSEDDLMRIGGWRSRSMVARYGSSLANQRARARVRPRHRSRGRVQRDLAGQEQPRSARPAVAAVPDRPGHRLGPPGRIDKGLRKFRPVEPPSS